MGSSPISSSSCRHESQTVCGPSYSNSYPLAFECREIETEMAKEVFQRTKPHVNVGTIGHIDHGKTTLTGAILAVQAAKGLAKFKSYADIAKGGTVRDETKTVTIAVTHVEYETDKRHYAHIDCPGPRRLHQEHDHRRRPDGRRDPGRFGRRRPDAADPRAHPPGPPGGRAGAGRVPQQDRPGRRRGVAGAGRVGAARAADQVRLPRRRHPDHPRQRAGGLRQSRRIRRPPSASSELLDAIDAYIPRAGARESTSPS